MARSYWIVRIEPRNRAFIWVLSAPNGKPVARSYESYVSRRNARRAVAAIFSIEWRLPNTGLIDLRSGPPIPPGRLAE